MKDSDKTAPATKEDISMLMDTIGKFYDDAAQWKQEIIEQTDHRFQVVAEELRHDLLGMHSDKVDLMNDKLKSHERRLDRLETQAGIAV